MREKYSPNSSFLKSFAHFVVGGSVLSTGSKYLETANMSPEQTKTVLQKIGSTNNHAFEDLPYFLRTFLKNIAEIYVLLAFGKIFNSMLNLKFYSNKICIILARVKGCRPSNWYFQFDVKSNIKLKFQAKLITFWKAIGWNKDFKYSALVSFHIELCL